MARSYTLSMLDQLVTQKRASETPDDMGGVTKTLATVASHWAHIRPMTGGEVLAAGRIEQRVNYLMVIRADGADVRPGDVFEWNGHTLPVREIKTVPRSPWLELSTELGAAP